MIDKEMNGYRTHIPRVCASCEFLRAMPGDGYDTLVFQCEAVNASWHVAYQHDVLIKTCDGYSQRPGAIQWVLQKFR